MREGKSNIFAACSPLRDRGSSVIELQCVVDTLSFVRVRIIMVMIDTTRGLVADRIQSEQTGKTRLRS